MPHYRDGTEAQIGDVVKGRGYNVPHDVIGVLVDIRTGSTCNLTVSCVSAASPMVAPVHRDADRGIVTTLMSAIRADSHFEYGHADAFDLVYRKLATT